MTHFTTDDNVATSASLERALADGNILPWFQPIVSLKTRRVVAAEALARWVDGDRVRAAGFFIRTAERAGLLNDISEVVTRQAAALSIAARINGKGLLVSVNCPPSDIGHLTTTFTEHAHHGAALAIELTEDDLVGDREQFREGLECARAAGVQIWADDFGVAHSSLSRLVRTDVQALKLDKSLTLWAGRNERVSVVVRFLGGACRELGVRMIGEGVETEEDVQALRDVGIEYAQGYHLGMPMPAAALIERIAQEKAAEATPTQSAASPQPLSL